MSTRNKKNIVKKPNKSYGCVATLNFKVVASSEKETMTKVITALESAGLIVSENNLGVWISVDEIDTTNYIL